MTMAADDDFAIDNPFLLAINIISILSSLILFYYGFTASKPMRTALKLVLLISLCDCFVCLTNVSSLIKSESHGCPVIGTFKYFCSWLQLFLCSLISLLSYLTMKEFGRFSIARLFRVAIMFCALLSLFLALMPILHISELKYTRVEGLCKITLIPGEVSIYDRIISVIIPITAYLMAIGTTIVGYARAYLISRQIPNEIKEAYNINSKRLLSYPAAQMVLFTPALIYNVVSTLTQYNYGQTVIIASIYSLSGLVNLLIYRGLVIQKRRVASVESGMFSEYDFDDSKSDMNMSTKIVQLTAAKGEVYEQLSLQNQEESLIETSKI